MKRLLILLLTLVPTVLLAQNQLGFFAGPQMTTAKYSVRGNKQETEYKTGFHVGATLKIPFEGNLYFAPELNYSLKGYKVQLTDYTYPPDTLAIDNNTTFHSVEMAALLQYDLSKKENHLFIKFGPVIDLQVSGKEKFNRRENEPPVSRSIPFAFNAYNRYSASFLLKLGYESKGGLILNAHYIHGVGSLNNGDFGPQIRHRGFGVSVGKYFIKKKKN